MKHTYLTLAAALLLAALPVRAQLTSSMTTIQHDSTFAQGRDFWFAMQSNYWGEDLGGKYMRIYITSATNCTAFVSANGTTTPVPVTADTISSFSVPESLEMESSGIAENKGIHVYSNTANLSVSFLSHNPYSSNSSYLIPSAGLGDDYVVAAHGSYYLNGAKYSYDYPSECTIAATQDSTTVTITPSCNCRKDTSGNSGGDSNASVVAFPAGQPFTVTLNRGQSLQLMPLLATNPDNFDLTGTIIHSNHPIGVIGGSMYTEIPNGYSNANFICDMLPPVRIWGETYYSTNLIQPPGETDKDIEEYLFISSQSGQIIYRSQCGGSAQVESIIDNQYGIYWDEISGAQKFYSSAPFLVVMYANSSTYPDSTNGVGYPSELTVTPRGQFAKSVLFETPLGVGNITPYDDYCNIFCNDSDAKNVTFDGKNIEGYGKVCLDDTFEVFNIPHISQGTHTVISDSGVAINIYGYGYDEFYAVSVPGTGVTFNSSDTIPPKADTSTMCYEAFIHVTDSGLLPNGMLQSGLSEIEIDSIYNMNFIIDPNWIEGSGADTSGYSISVIDPSQPAIAIVQVNDMAGNVTTVTTAYKPNFVVLDPPIENLGVWISGSPNIAFDTIVNEGQTLFDLSVLHLRYGNAGFTLFDSIGGPLDLSPVPVGGRRVIEIEFQAKTKAVSNDSIIVGNDCDSISVALTGSGQASGVAVENPSLNATIIPTNDGHSLAIILPSGIIDPVSFQLVNVLGESVLRSAFGAGTQNVDASSLPRGVYFYRLTSGQLSQSGKIILGE